MIPDSHKHPHHRGCVDHHPQPKLPGRGLHKDWRTWLVIGLMLAAMGVYVLTLDDSIQPGGADRDGLPAAAAPASPPK